MTRQSDLIKLSSTQNPICYLIGQGNLLRECAKILRSRSFVIKGIISHSSDIKAWAQSQRIEWFESLSEVDWKENSVDYLFSVVNNEIIPTDVLQSIHGLTINYHDAPLPRYAGSNATAWAILNNEVMHGITWHAVNEIIDGGDILKQIAIPVLPDETAVTLNMKCIEQAITAFSDLANELLNNSYQRVPQDLSLRTFFTRSKKPPSNGWINWHSSAEEIDKLCRATQFGDYDNPFAVAKIVLNGDIFIVNALAVLNEQSNLVPGTVLKINLDSWEISTKTHNVLLSGLSTTQGRSVELATLVKQYNIHVGIELSSPKSEQCCAEQSEASAEERQQLLVDWNNTDTPYPAHKTIHGLFEEQANKTPHHVALIAPDAQLTYQELNKQANQLANYLITHHAIQPDQLIAVCLERSQWMLIALLGILKSGGAYVPLDPSYPEKRISYILDDTDARVILTTQAQEKQLRQMPNIDWQKTKLLVLDHPDFLRELEQQSTLNPVTKTTSRHLAYVMFTSGSTGNPKGVQIEHQGIVNQIFWMNQTYPLRSSDRILQKTTYVFDISVWELFWASWFGAAVIFAKPDGHKEPDYLIQLILKEQISIIQFTPSMLNVFIFELANKGECLPCLRHLFCIGEVLTEITVNKVYKLLPEVAIHNIYGPTEASINVLNYECIRQQPILIGKPISNTRVYVLDEQCRLLPVGASGELYLAGTGLARGYLNQAELTSQKFISNPFQTEQDKKTGQYSRLYKTGDLACWLPSGQLDYLGRNDTQIKLNGYRIELGEIESCLNRYSGIKQAIVTIRQFKNSSHPYLIGYYVAQEKLKEDDIFFYLKEHLPDYMVPTYLVQLDAIPLTVNGKADKKALPEPAIREGQSYVPAETDLENQLVSIWSAVLDVPQKHIGVADSFFKLGGNSLLMIKLKNQISKLSPFESITLADLFKYTTILQLSHAFESNSPSEPDQIKKTYSTQETDIAIISISGAFSGGCDLDHYWKLIQSGKEGIQSYGLDECRQAGVSEDLLQNPLFVPSSGHIPDIDLFDAPFWGISPKEAKNLDPQVRLFLEHCWYTLEKSNYLAERQKSNIGVFAAAGQQRYCPNSNIFPLATNDALAPQVSYFLGLTGPSNNINTACSGSLVTVVEACKNLAGGYCDLALAGGVSLLLPEERGYIYQEGMIYSQDGHCRVFDAQSSGTVFGSGVGVVLLKRLSEAKRDNDRIIGVIKGYASNNDGDRKISYTAPSVFGQKECFITAQEMASISSDVIDYVECHGTGTILGDPVEVQALDEAFKYNAKNSRLHPCILGSVKANIGHADTAAGIAGLIKVCKMLENELMPPQINYVQPNPELRLANTYFAISTEAQEWKASEEKPRIAAVNSFGIGGTNAHVIITEPPGGTTQSPSRKRASLTKHHFNRQSYWLESSRNKGLNEPILLPKNEWVSTPVWKKLGKFSGNNQQNFSQSIFLIFKDKDDVSFDTLSLGINQVIFVNFDKTINEEIEFLDDSRLSIRTASESVYQKLFAYLEKNRIKPDIVIHAITLKNTQISEVLIDDELEKGFYSLFLIQKYILTTLLAPLKFIVMTRGVAQITGEDTINSYNAAMVGALRTIKHELPRIKSCIVDCSYEPIVLNDLLEFISKDFHFIEENLYAIKFHALWVESLESPESPLLLQESIIKDGDVILITGGLGGLGLAIAEHIAQKNKVTFVLVGRHAFLASDGNPTNPQISLLEKIKFQGCAVDIRCVDVANLKEVESLVEAIYTQYHQLSGIIHAAGIAPLTLNERSFDNVKLAIRAKVHGSAYFLKAIKSRKINYFVMMSSLASMMGDVNRIEYCAANSSLDYLANSNEFPIGCRVLSLNWPNWSEVGMAMKQSIVETSNYNSHLEHSILNTVSPKEGAELFYDLIQQSNYSQLVVSKLSIPLLKQKFFRNKQESFVSNLENITKKIIETNLSKLHYQIAQLFLDILGIEKFSVHDGFFDLGGNSLDAIDLLTQLQKMGISLDLSDLAVNNSVYRIEYFHENNLPNEPLSKIVLPLSIYHQTNRNVFFVHPVGGTVLLYLDIIKDLTKEYNYFGIQNINISGKALLKVDNLEALSEIYVREILKIQPDGEYILMGSSMGGTIAYEMATQLINMGKKVKFVAMFDSWAFFSKHFYDKSSFTNTIKEQIEKYKHLFSGFKKTDMLLEASWNLMTILLNYRPKKGAVNVHLYKAEKLDQDHVTNGTYNDSGWQQYTSLPLDIHLIPGTHMTMHFEPGRTELIKLLNKSLLAT
jgi:amino acid adenylation domain-containing protein